MNQTIAVLLTCFNRHLKTIECLESLYKQDPKPDVNFDIYLVDDSSPDHTGQLIQERFPQVKVIFGNGSLFWVGGMRLAWEEALKSGYDGYLLINDDVLMTQTMFASLLETHKYSLEKYKQGGIYIGSTKDPDTDKLSYGGRTLLNKLTGKSVLKEPDPAKPVECDFAHANILLVMKNVVTKIGILNQNFTQRLADYDYTLKARKNGFPLLISSMYCGICKDDHGKNWLSSEYSLSDRISYLKNPKYLAYEEYLLFMKWHFPYYRPIAFTKLWMKTLFPSIWNKLKS
jgi:GT2 family glycosyltransferase